MLFQFSFPSQTFLVLNVISVLLTCGIEPLVCRTNICRQVEELATSEFQWLGVGEIPTLHCRFFPERKHPIGSLVYFHVNDSKKKIQWFSRKAIYLPIKLNLSFDLTVSEYMKYLTKSLLTFRRPEHLPPKRQSRLCWEWNSSKQHIDSK